MRLAQLPRNSSGIVEGLEAGADDPIARRLGELGFVPGETVRVVAVAPLGGDPLVVEIGDTRFALRRSEAARVRLQVPA
ncbi:FeoA family protein [Coralloluteibacterium thermophilus]|uniref:Ferrous iron transport protein A n=1 Tax=Coralloluteibacterium thermophilum TaxID=2707049 RepID=A0ABV9NKD3_9GAMM